MWQELIIAFGLMLVLEGILPFLYPRRWQRMVETIAQMDPSAMRMAGLASMVIGLIIIYIAR